MAALERVDVGDLRIAYRRAGDGVPILLLHGAVCDSRVWRVELETFADEFDVVAWDAPGCGGSSDPPESFRMPEYADVLERFIGKLGLERPLVLGHSWGSTLALELSRRGPERTRGLVLVGAYAGWAGSLLEDEVEHRLAFALSTADAVESGTWTPTSMPGLFSDAMPADRARELAASMSEIRAATTRTMARALSECDLRQSLHKITTPTLLVAGGADERSGLSVAQALNAAIPGSILEVLPELGHECYLEDPAAFDTAIREFLRGRSS